MLEKLKSRKFILAVVTMVIGIVTALTELGGTVGAVCGVIAAIASPMLYIIVEGNVDAKAVKLTKDAVQRVIELSRQTKGVGENGENK
jgi:hypothetical protein